MVKLTRIYTKGGDKGETSLGRGERVAKHDPRVEAYGTVDDIVAARPELAGLPLEELFVALTEGEPPSARAGAPSGSVAKYSRLSVFSRYCAAAFCTCARTAGSSTSCSVCSSSSTNTSRSTGVCETGVNASLMFIAPGAEGGRSLIILQ